MYTPILEMNDTYTILKRPSYRHFPTRQLAKRQLEKPFYCLRHFHTFCVLEQQSLRALVILC